MDHLIELARQLGRQVAQHERTALLRQAREAVEADDEAQKLIEAYRQQIERINRLEQTQQPVEVADKHKLDALQKQVNANTKIQQLTRRQADFLELMHKVRQAMDEQLEDAV